MAGRRDGPRQDAGVRGLYGRLGVRATAEQHFGRGLRNPHEGRLRALLGELAASWPLDLGCVLDLAAGTGEVTAALQELGCREVEGCDPYTAAAYTARTGRPCLALSFEELARGRDLPRRYSLVVCSYALHLVAPSWLPAVLFALGRRTDSLLLLSPHKRPGVRPEWGWRLRAETSRERVRARLYGRGDASGGPGKRGGGVARGSSVD